MSSSADGMIYTDEESAPEMPITELETELTRLKMLLADLPLTWKAYAPGVFMDEMRRLQKKFNNLTPETVLRYVDLGGGFQNDLDALQVHEADLKNSPAPASLEPWRNRRLPVMRQCMISHVINVQNQLKVVAVQARAKPPPNEFADHNQWQRFQDRDDAIFCLRPANKRGLPMPLMHTAFCNFTRHYHEPILDEHMAKCLTVADKLCQTMPSAFDDEDDRRNAFEGIFLSLDLTAHIYSEGHHLNVIVKEFQEETTGDIYMQACRSYEVLCEETEDERLLKFGYPMFLLCILGPNLMICGAIRREKVHVEPLTPLLPMLPGIGVGGRTNQIAHCLRALKEGLDTLREFRRAVEILKGAKSDTTASIPPEPYVSGCPDNGLLRFHDWHGTFGSVLKKGNDYDKVPSFTAKLCKADDEHQVEVVVKFLYSYTDTYGTAVHNYLYNHGLAPLLYSVENLHRGLIMVVMERLPLPKDGGGWVELDTFEGKLGERAGAVRKKLERIIDLLQEQRMVHVDLRPNNVMVKVDGSGEMVMDEHGPIFSLIDFDCAGKVGEVRYPPFLNPAVPWPAGAKGYLKVGEKHDRNFLNNWWDAFVKGVSC